MSSPADFDAPMPEALFESAKWTGIATSSYRPAAFEAGISSAVRFQCRWHMERLGTTLYFAQDQRNDGKRSDRRRLESKTVPLWKLSCDMIRRIAFFILSAVSCFPVTSSPRTISGRLRELLGGIKGKFLLSINDHPTIWEWYGPFFIEGVEKRYTIAKQSKRATTSQGAYFHKL